MTVEEIKLELEGAEKFLEKIEKESESEDICAIYAMELPTPLEEDSLSTKKENFTLTKLQGCRPLSRKMVCQLTL